MEQATATIQARLPVVSQRHYDHTADGRYVDTETGEVLDSIPTAQP